jgi:hypothetical protein
VYIFFYKSTIFIVKTTIFIVKNSFFDSKSSKNRHFYSKNTSKMPKIPSKTHLSQVIVPLFEPQTRKPQRRLPAAPVLLGQVHGELVQNLPVVALV